jgi:NADPH:quinone reductase-like Zn-dependent oxidoreductase
LWAEGILIPNLHKAQLVVHPSEEINSKRLKAIIYNRYGGIEALQIQEVEKPTPRENEVLVKVYAVSINDWDWGKMDDSSVFNRLTSGLRRPRHQILGSDIAGKVEAVGKNVSSFKVGDDVYGDLSGQWGGFAEYCCASEKALALKPASMSFLEAAAIPQAAMLSVQGLIDKGKIKNREKILINGAGGGVGTFGVQIARLFDAEVTGVDHTDKLDMLRALGFDHVIDYTKEDFTEKGKQYDLILDAKTNRPVFHYLRALNPNGRYVTVGGSLSRLFQTLLLLPFISVFSKKKVSIVALKPNKDLAYINELFETGKVKPIIDGYYKLEDVPNAFRLFAQAGHKGKIVISVDDKSTTG